jgi:hypothetical protein
MNYGDPELLPARGRLAVAGGVRRLGAARHPRNAALSGLCRCGRERDDLADFYADPPTQPRLAV